MRLPLLGLCLLVAPTVIAVPPTPEGAEQQAFDSFMGKHPNLTLSQFSAGLKSLQFLPKIDFDPTKAKFFNRVRDVLQLSTGAQSMLKAHGFVAVDGGQRYSMGSMYQQIYMKDLPVLITTDSILHAAHVSFDNALKRLESEVFNRVIRTVLMDTRAQVVAWSKKGKQTTASRNSSRDVELYLTVALNLLRGAGGQSDDRKMPWDGKIQVLSSPEQDNAVLDILKKVQALEMDKEPGTQIYGDTRMVDWSQFAPRGHYTDSPDLQMYFRAMMWMGRADTGFNLTEDPAGTEVDTHRELRAAALLARALKVSGSHTQLEEVNAVIEFMVGESDNLTPAQMLTMLPEGSLTAKNLAALRTQIIATGQARQRTASQWLVSLPNTPEKVVPPALFQLFGQRFLVDSFVLSKVVFDQIVFKGEKQKRLMPSGLDVMAALGNDEAARLLQPELEQWHYANNLQSARDVVEAYPATYWQGNLYRRWLDILRTLDDRPAGDLPQAMKTQAWAGKSLRTQLASWAELRHDTILYGKQSYSISLGCEYPAAFVEPNPAFFAKMAAFGEDAARLLNGTKLTTKDAPEVLVLQHSIAAHFANLGKIAKRLEGLARKELAGKPFSADEQDWLKKTIDQRMNFSGPPTYSGWYSTLFYDTHPDKWNPTVADVHTSSQGVLEVGVGDAQFLVLAVDNGPDRQVYVGPTYTYYEFVSPSGKRLTDAEWQRRIYDGTLPAAPAWTNDFTVQP